MTVQNWSESGLLIYIYLKNIEIINVTTAIKNTVVKVNKTRI